MDIEKLHQELHISHIPSYTSIILSHMVYCILVSKEEPQFMVLHEEHVYSQMFEQDQAFEFPLRESHTFIEDEEKHTIAKLSYGGIHASTFSMDENW